MAHTLTPEAGHSHLPQSAKPFSKGKICLTHYPFFFRERDWTNTKSWPYYAVVSTLVKAGAKLEPELYEADDEGRRAMKQFRSDPRMAAALGLKAASRKSTRKKKEQ